MYLSSKCKVSGSEVASVVGCRVREGVCEAYAEYECDARYDVVVVKSACMFYESAR